MPKTKLQTRLPPQARLGALINGTLVLQKFGAGDVASWLGCSEPTARSRLRNPGELTVAELTRIGKCAGIPIDELRGAISYQ